MPRFHGPPWSAPSRTPCWYFDRRISADAAGAQTNVSSALIELDEPLRILMMPGARMRAAKPWQAVGGLSGVSVDAGFNGGPNRRLKLLHVLRP